MPSKVKPVAVRLSGDQLARIDARADAEGKSRHSMIVALLDAALDGGSSRPKKSDTSAKPSPKAILAAAEARAAHLAPAKRSGLDMSFVPIGPPAVFPGSRLKQPPKGRR